MELQYEIMRRSEIKEEHTQQDVIDNLIKLGACDNFLETKKRDREIVVARQLFQFACVHVHKFNKPKKLATENGWDRTTVLYNMKQVQNMIEVGMFDKVKPYSDYCLLVKKWVGKEGFKPYKPHKYDRNVQSAT